MRLSHFFLYFLIACTPQKQKSVYREIIVESNEFLACQLKNKGNNLYEDKAGALYFRVIDRSAINENHEVFADYINYLRFDTLINKEESYVEKELKDVIDCETFKFREKIGQANYYEDRKHRYFHLEVASGGVLHCYE